MEERS